MPSLRVLSPAAASALVLWVLPALCVADSFPQEVSAAGPHAALPRGSWCFPCADYLTVRRCLSSLCT